jgi:hypothetical protein
MIKANVESPPVMPTTTNSALSALMREVHLKKASKKRSNIVKLDGVPKDPEISMYL